MENKLENMINIQPYMDNANEKISGLVGSSLGGTILEKPYRRPDPQNPEGVFDYVMNKKEQQEKANGVAIQDLKDNEPSQVVPESLPENENPINPDNSPISKLLNQNNITDNKKVLENGMFPQIIFPENTQLPTSKVLEGFTSNSIVLYHDIILFIILVCFIFIIYTITK